MASNGKRKPGKNFTFASAVTRVPLLVLFASVSFMGCFVDLRCGSYEPCDEDNTCDVDGGDTDSSDGGGGMGGMSNPGPIA